MVTVVGLLIVAAGLVLWKFAGKLPLGRLPGDITIEKPGASFYFPVTTCILISVILSVLLWIFRK